MPTIRLEPKLWPGAQQDFLKAVVNNKTAKKFMFCGAAQVGKNYVGKWAFLSRIAERIRSGIPGEAWILAPDYDLTVRAREDFLEVLPREFLLDKHEERKGPSWYKLAGGVTVEIRSASDPEKIRSKTLFVVLFDELSKSLEAAYLNTLLRLEVEDGTLLVTTTPCNSESPWLDELHDKFQNDPDFVWVHCGIEENLLMSKERIRKLREQFPDEYGQEVLDGCFIKSRTGLVYKNWNGAKQIIESYEVKDDDEIWSAADSGLNHPFAYGRLAMSKTGHVTLFEEIYGRNLAPSDQVALVKSGLLEKRIKERYFDPSAALVRAEFHKAGLWTRSAKNNVDDGIRCFYALISARDDQGEPIFHVTRSCRNFIREIGLYRFRKEGSTYSSDVVVKKHDDMMDMCRYAWYSRDPSVRSRITGIKTSKDLQPAVKSRPHLATEIKQADGTVLRPPAGRYFLTGMHEDLTTNVLARKQGRAGRSWMN